jgi:hypothetical protein
MNIIKPILGELKSVVHSKALVRWYPTPQTQPVMNRGNAEIALPT